MFSKKSSRIDGKPIYSREKAQVRLARQGQEDEAKFLIDWHLVALPIVQEKSQKDPLFIFKEWLRRMLILRPIPSLISGDSKDETFGANSLNKQFWRVVFWSLGLGSRLPMHESTPSSVL